MVYLKTLEEIKIMREAGRIAASALGEVKKHIKVGISTGELDKIAEKAILKLGATPSFKRVEGYSNTICATPNDLVVHGIPSEYKLKTGDILGIDIGAYYNGFHSDMAETFCVGKCSPEKQRFLQIGERALWRAIKDARAVNRVGDISSCIQTEIEKAGYSVVKELVGHGVGRSLHEDPLVPGKGRAGSGPRLKEGMVLAIEVIYTMGKGAVTLLSDGWSIRSKDKSPSGLFERTIAVTDKGPVVLTAI